MQPVIDADTHIAESEAMWQMIDGNMYPRRPVLLSLPDDTLYGGWNATWLIDGNIFPKPVGKGGFRLVTPSASKIQSNRRDIQVACRQLTDVAARLADRGGITAQVVYPTLFLIYLTDDAELDVALSRAYNRFMAQACAQSHDRIHWVAIPPLRCIEESVKELKWAKQNGAVGVFFRGMEGDLTLDNPYFFPVYQTAMELDSVHRRRPPAHRLRLRPQRSRRTSSSGDADESARRSAAESRRKDFVRQSEEVLRDMRRLKDRITEKMFIASFSVSTSQISIDSGATI
ncbi:MAG TPA: hypothetical protein VGK57_18880 [Candidatus Binatia bacterium]